ncbi:MAG TPA: serine hydrolase [Dermatophilaceae bacterium]|nr:serine hydrolase [Dermatophilaceae bacterium]
MNRRQALLLTPLGVAGGLVAWAAAANGADPTSASRSGGPTTIPATSTSATPTVLPGPPVGTRPSPPAAPRTFAERSAAATAALKARKVGGRVVFGVAIHNARTRETFSYRGGTQFETASIAKADILAALLLRAQDDADDAISGYQRSLAVRMITVSDNNAAHALWRMAGGSSGVGRANRRLGLRDTDTSSFTWGLIKTTPADQVRLLGCIAGDRGSPLSAASSDYLLDLMSEVSSAQTWGVPAIVRNGERYAVKNGWLPRSIDSYRWIVNSIGRISGPKTDLRVAVLSRGNASMGAGIALVEGVARQVRAELRW